MYICLCVLYIIYIYSNACMLIIYVETAYIVHMCVVLSSDTSVTC